ncbi:LEAF RUST 10 DISEASE-RESISTANCE LOCUS RECEPTOR-LIKE PROTEIN KINASE-like 2.1 [Hevea brasiliensis]|uniref:LEAF RUST 10 DISEASE-RESISTANCE LOCUS RECEPTOR-LIKE PROTEIN KINASE-like 2.1 n=1 Tax=Hevea brasiliensis TaxID=3981 RepID=UPI0025DE29A9|nr:LEAF RUST 10 DISEASE-RESISTANCE LOCUS RECEPTOR-LIKE PROTEIN KINASE-like 2.1 [Hevea brasiliensis]
MDAHVFLLPHVHFIITFFFLLVFVPTSYCEEDGLYRECFTPFQCGHLSNLSYPFWSDERPEICGYQGFKLRCREGPIPIITIKDQEFYVNFVYQSERVMIISRKDLSENICLPGVAEIPNTTLNETPFSYVPEFENVNLFYNCSNEVTKVPTLYKIPCTVNGEQRDAFYATDWLLSKWNQDPSDCNIRVEVPVPKVDVEQLISGGMEALSKALREGFNVTYMFDTIPLCSECVHSGGICGTNSSTFRFTCLCRDQPYPYNCPKAKGNGGSNVIQKIVIGITVGVVGISIACAFNFCFKKIPSVSSIISLQKIVKNNQDLEAFLKNHGPLAVCRYSFSEVKKMTNLFKDKLGQGGYGSVYKGKLFDGRLVAVKVLNASKGEGQEFINEVASISRTSHINIVTLLGFCFEGQKRALIFEFMPNGYLDKFICYKSPLKSSDQHLGWETMHQIAIGVAQGLEYLHRGCNTRIVHFDIKPHILLDENFCPKISDFGLAKLCTRKDSIISMLEARGTIGYIAPEVFSRNFGGVSSKSDVYSYGMMVLDMVGGREEDVGTDHTSEKYFPHWIYRQLEQGNKSKLCGEISIEENEIIRKLTIIGLWCIQIIPSERPSMSKVIEMLKGSIKALNIPPKQFLSSPPRSPSTTFTISMTK